MIDSLERLDGALGGRPGRFETLAPGRSVPTPLAELFAALTGGKGGPRAEALGRGLVVIAEAVVEHFPGNLFWDLDLLAAALWQQESATAMNAMTDTIVRLQAGFGRHTTIRFRYAHDFLYGFDWCRWVARAPEARSAVGVYDARFLAYLEKRQQELIALIAEDDAKYPRLAGESARNPFGFSREPDDEARLHRALAAEDLVPAKAWDTGGTQDAMRPYARLREDMALRLGMATRPS